MTSFEKISKILEQNAGYLTAQGAAQNGINGTALHRAQERGLIERVAAGLYVGEETIADPYVIVQYRCPKGVFSHETALFLNELSDRAPLRLTMTVPAKWNSKMLTSNEMKFFYCKPEWMDIGVFQGRAPSGRPVQVFDKERTLCDCLRAIDKLDKDLVLTALKRYMGFKDRDNAKLLKYAETFKIRETVFRYMEVLI